MADQIKPESLPVKRKLALTEDEHQLIETYRQKNLATDSFNAGLDKAIEIIIAQSMGSGVHSDTIRGFLTGIEAQRKSRVSPL